MMRLPYDDPGLPDTRSPARLLLWVGRRQLPTLIAGIVLGILWMVAQAMMPYAIGRAIGDGLTDGDNRALALWSVVLLGLGVLQAVAGIRSAPDGGAQLAPGLVSADPGVVHHVARTGPAVRTRLTTGEVVATVSNDAIRAGGAFDITARLAGAIASYIVVAFVLLSASTALGAARARGRARARALAQLRDPAAPAPPARAA